MSFRFVGTVTKWNDYGDRSVARWDASIIADSLDEAKDKARALFNAEYDSFRKFWSHSFNATSVTEIPQNTEAIPPDLGCPLPPEGWWCSREVGHDGPCAARPNA